MVRTDILPTHPAVAIDREAATCRRDAARGAVQRAIQAYDAGRLTLGRVTRRRSKFPRDAEVGEALAAVSRRRAGVLRAIYDLAAAEETLMELGGAS